MLGNDTDKITLLVFCMRLEQSLLKMSNRSVVIIWATNNFPLRYKVYADMNPCLLYVHDHQVILEQIEARENFNHNEYVEEEDY